MKGFNLLQFPIEILALIFNRPASSQHVITLWKCGSPLLNRRLVQCITNLTLVDTEIFSPSRFPLAISELKGLRQLTIDRGQGTLTGSTHLLFSALHLLPAGLQKLSIYSEDAAGCLFNRSTSQTKSHDWSLILPNLKELEIMFHGRSTVSFTFHFPKLPFQLERLIYSECSYFDQESAKNFPPSLKHFETWTQMFAEPAYHPIRLKQNVQPLGVIYFDSLYEGRLPPLISAMSSDAVQPEYRSSYPLCKWVDVLPKSLKYFKLYDRGDYTADAIRRLPRTLETLKGENSIYWAEIEEIGDKQGQTLARAIWPPALTELETTRPPTIASNLEYLPSTLTSFRMFISDKIDLVGLDFLPNLSSLHIDIKGTEGTVITNWPPKLTSLTIKGSPDSFQLEHSLRSNLPASLRTLVFAVSYFEPDYAEFVLPPGITHLEVEKFDTAWLKALPPTLKELTITTVYIESAEVIAKFFDMLPLGLEMIAICDCESSTHIDMLPFSGDSLPRLSNLRLLILPNISLPSAVLGTLPDGIEHINLRLKEKVQEKDLAMLPASLRQFTLRDSSKADLSLTLKPHMMRLFEKRRGLKATEHTVPATGIIPITA